MVIFGRYAAIDIGTVTCRLMVADVGISSALKLKVVAKERAIVNLGEGVDATKRISDAAMQRTAEAIDGFVAKIHELNTPENPIISTSVMATSASRDAENADEFKAMLAERGLSMDVIPGTMEAKLSFMGASSSRVGQPVMVVDSGGGSTEIAIGKGGDDPKRSHSFDIGCRRITERFWDSYPPDLEKVGRARDQIRAQLNAWDGFAELLPKTTMIAVAGTATSIVSMRDEMEVYNPDLVDGQIVTTIELASLLDRMLKMTLEELQSMVGLEPRRAPVICAGMLILLEVMRAASLDSFVVSESDILDGMIMYNSTKTPA